MLTPHLLSLAAAIALALVAPAWGQQQQPMSASLVNQLQDVEVQEQLIALGVLDSTAGQASRDDLRKAVDWFRRAYQFKRGMEALDDAEKLKLKEAKDKFYATTGLKVVTYKDSDPRTKTDLRLLVPLKFVSEAPQKFIGTAIGGDWQEYRDNVGNVSVGPVIHLLSDFTPIALFRQNIMQVALNYRRLHLTSEEFAAVGDAEDKDGGYVSSNLVLTSKDKLMGVLMRYRKTPPTSFVEVPDFLARGSSRAHPVRRAEAGSDNQRLAAHDAGCRQSGRERVSPRKRLVRGGHQAVPGDAGQGRAEQHPHPFRHGSKGECCLQSERRTRRQSRFSLPQRAGQQAASRVCLRRASQERCQECWRFGLK